MTKNYKHIQNNAKRTTRKMIKTKDRSPVVGCNAAGKRDWNEVSDVEI
jgi:hypothetical protein